MGGDGITRRFFCALLFFAALAAPVLGEDDGIRQSVVLVLDLSYSMRLKESSGLSRLEMVRSGLRELLTRPVEGVEWAIVEFDDTDSIWVAHPFTADCRSLLASVSRLRPGRLSPLADALDFAVEYLIENARSDDRKVLLVSDGISTQGLGFHFQLSRGYQRQRIPLFLLGFSHEHNPQIRESLSDIAAYTGGSCYTFGHIDLLKQEILQPWKVARRSGRNPTFLASAGNTVLPDPSSTGEGGGFPYYILWLIFAVLLFALAAFLRYRTVMERRRWEAAKGHPRTFLHLAVEEPGSRTREIRTAESPLLVGTTQSCHIRLANAKRKVVFTYRWDAEGADFSSDRAFILNGVAVKTKKLKNGDRLKCDSYRLVFRGLEVETPEMPQAKDYTLYPLASGVFSLFLFFLLFAIQNIQLPRDATTETAAVGQPDAAAAEETRRLGEEPSSIPFLLPEPTSREPAVEGEAAVESETREPAVEGEAAVESETRERVVEEAAAKEPAAREPAAREPAAEEATTERKPVIVKPQEREVAAAASTSTVEKAPALKQETIRKRENAYSEDRPASLQKKLDRIVVTMVAPGERIPFTKLDILFIHAHPDDESLDFGGLIARAHASGKQIATVLFTDGEAGLDQFPDRPTNGIYSAEELSGEALGQVRIQEAAAALEILGSPLYVRFGYENHPYNSSRDVIEVEEVLQRWGGRAAVSAGIEELIRGFKPEIVVCCDFNPRAYEHFEHKAVGLIARDVLLDLKAQGFEAAKGFLVSVDPFQDLYEELIRLDLMVPHPGSGYSYREIQVAALKEHQTQGDSSLIGVELLPNFGWEQYLPVYWDLEVSLEEYLTSG